MKPSDPLKQDDPRPNLWTLFLVFAKVSLLAVGGGYVIIPLLLRDVVQTRHWITEEELTDCYSVGQSVPGIIAMNTAALIGYRRRGLAGALAAAAGMATPSILVMLLIVHLLTDLFDAPLMHKALGGVRAAVVAMVAAAVWQIGQRAVTSRVAVVLCVGAFLALIVWGVSPILLTVCGAVAGILLLKPREEVE